MTSDTTRSPKTRFDQSARAASALLLAVLVWSYNGPIWALIQRWYNDPDYVHGFLVPFFAVYLLWARRSLLESVAWNGSWWGLAFLAVAATMRWTSAYFYYNLPDPASLIPCLIGVVLLVGGWSAIRWAWPALIFLVFMIPLPSPVAGVLSHPLQRIGTKGSVYLIQTLGIPAMAQGNVIMLSNAKLAVVEACNGIRMLMLFFTVCVGAALLLRRPPLVKAIIVASAVPIAVVANILRITLTAILFQFFPAEYAERFFHDLAGWFMMPSAVLLLWCEMWVLERMLTVEPLVDSATATVAAARQTRA